MSDPIAAQNAPYVLELDAGTYWWCACGRSKQQPFCDGSHQGTGIEPQSFELKARTKVALCGCKRTQGAPFCDGAHKKG